MRNLLGQVDEVYMKEPLFKLRREVGRMYADPLTRRREELGNPVALITDEAIVMCRYCGAFVRLIGIPPDVEPGGPQIALYYPIQYCPVCGIGVGRALWSERAETPLMGAPILHPITCTQCHSKLMYKTQALPPQYLSWLRCPVCGAHLEVKGLEVGIIEAEPWPVVAEEPEEPEKIPWKPIIIVGAAFTMLSIGAGIGYFMNSRKKK